MTNPEELLAIAGSIIDSNRYMTLATPDETGLPWATPVWYAPRRYREFFWVSSPEARHSRSVATRPEVGIVIFDSHQPGGWHAVYMSAVAEELYGAEVEEGIEVFSGRSRKQEMPAWTGEDVRPPPAIASTAPPPPSTLSSTPTISELPVSLE